MKNKDHFRKIPLCLFCVILATVPLLFGAVHPIVQGCYVFLVLAGLGGSLCYSLPEEEPALIARGWLVPLVLLLAFAALQSIPLPLSWIEILSPARAERVAMVNNLAGTTQHLVPLSDYGLLSLSRAVLLLALLIYFASLKFFLRQDEKVVWIILGIVTIVGLLEALYGLFQFLSPRIGILWLALTRREAHGTIIYKNQYASLLNLCWPLALAGATIYFQKSQLSRQSRARRQKLRDWIRRMGNLEREVPFFFFATGVMLLAVFFSLSRGGIISLLMVLLLLTLFLPVSRKAKLLFPCLLIFFVMGYGGLLGLETLIIRFDSIGASGSTRIATYLASLPMLKDHWLTGIGLGSYTLLSPIYLKNFSPNVHFDKAHNEFLQMAIELGVPATLLFFSWLAGAMTHAGKILLGKMSNPEGEVDSSIVIGGAAFCGLTGFFVHGLVDFGWHLPANLFYAVTLAALVSHGLERCKGKRERIIARRQ